VGNPLLTIVVYPGRAETTRHALPTEREDEARLFRQLVSDVQATGALQSLKFLHQDFGRSDDADARGRRGGAGRRGWGRGSGLTVTSSRRDEDVDRLFRQVLPSHPTLESVNLAKCRLPTRAIQAFMEGLASVGASVHLSFLTIQKCRISIDGVRPVAAMLRTNVSLKELQLDDWIAPGDQGDGTAADGHDREHDHRDSCRVLLDAVAHNAHLRRLYVEDPLLRIDVGATTIALGPGSTRPSLNLTGRFTPEGLADLLFRLRTNESLEWLDVRMVPNPVSTFQRGLVEELLLTYNCTLKFARFIDEDALADRAAEERFQSFLLRNRAVSIAREHLESRNYAIGPAAAWPRVLERVSRFPTLLYRFLRRVNAPGLAEHVSLSRATATATATATAEGGDQSRHLKRRATATRATRTRRRRVA
jgi:hypothetical protein